MKPAEGGPFQITRRVPGVGVKGGLGGEMLRWPALRWEEETGGLVGLCVLGWGVVPHVFLLRTRNYEGVVRGYY